MIGKDSLDAFAERSATKPAGGNRKASLSAGGRGIAESPDALQAYLQAHGVTVRSTKAGAEGATILILDGCAMNPDHGKGSDTAVVLRANGVIGFACKHNSCNGYTWADVRKRIDPDYKASAEATTIADPWEPPITLGRFELPAFPLEAIPKSLCAFCEFCAAVGESYQVPVDLPALLGLAVGGAALAKRIRVHVRADHFEPVNLFVAVAMEPGERKSAVFRAVCQPMTDFERDENERLAPKIEQYRHERAILEASITHAQGKAARALPENREKLCEKAGEFTEQLRALTAIQPVRLIADDATPEALGKLLAEQGGRIALLSPEGDTFEQMAGRYDKKGVPNLGVYLKGHAGDDLRVDRVNKDRPPEFVSHPALTVGLAVQPEVLHGLAAKPGFRGRGLLGRFIYSLPTSLVGYQKLDPKPVPRHIEEAYHRLIRTALALQPSVNDAGKPCAHLVHVSPDALAQLFRFMEFVQVAVREGGELAAMRDWANKLVGAVCRIGGIFHGLAYASGGNPGGTAMDVETMVCAIGVGEYAIAHARAAYFEMACDNAIGLARRILSWLQEEHPTEFKARDAFNMLRGTVHTMDGMSEPLRLLTTHGYIRERIVEHRGPGRKPSTPYEVNPYFYAQNEQIAHKSPADLDSAHSAHSAQGVRQ